MEWHKKTIFDFHLMKYDYPVLNYKRARGWHLYVYKDGSADLFQKVGPNGALLGKPIRLPAPVQIVNEEKHNPLTFLE